MLAIKKAAKWLWNSPTFTTWGNYGIQSLRLLLVTPLILTRFDETEIAAWFLFASLNFFGTIIGQRIGLTFSRMFAFAMGGASNLAPIKEKQKQENDGQPNWGAFERAYGTISSLNLGIAWINVFIALGMGWFGLHNILDGYEGKGVIWLSFGVMQVSSLITFIYQRYNVALTGMNYVALWNRWNILFSLLSVLGGIISLFFSQNLLLLVCVMQSIILLALLKARALVGQVEEGRVARMKNYTFDREVFTWSWEPIWKGFLGQFGQVGSQYMIAIIYTAYGSKSEIATFLFSLRMMHTISYISQAPFNSVLPLMSRLRASARNNELSTLIVRRINISMSISIFLILISSFTLPFLLELINSNVALIERRAWLLLGAFTVVTNFIFMCCAMFAIANRIMYYWDLLIASFLSLSLIIFLRDGISIYKVILAMHLPLLLILNIRPYLKAKSSFPELRTHAFGLKAFFILITFFILAPLLIIV